MKPESLTKRIWLHMLGEGGRWTVRELASEMRVDYGSVHGTMTSMSESGSVARHERSEGEKSSVQFSVTNSCSAPKGVTVSDFTNAAKKAMAL